MGNFYFPGRIIVFLSIALLCGAAEAERVSGGEGSTRPAAPRPVSAEKRTAEQAPAGRGSGDERSKGAAAPRAAKPPSAEDRATVAAPSRAEERPAGRSAADTIYYIPEIIVSAKGPDPDMELFNRSGFVALIDLEEAPGAVDDATSILANSAGIRVRQYGGLGSFATSSIRGSSSSQVEVYLDGVPLNDPYSGMTNIADLSLGNVERIEIYRGFSPVSFGGSSIGGTINLVTARGERNAITAPFPDISAEASAGSFGMRRYSIDLSAPAGPARFDLYGGYMESEGDFSFLDDNATPANPLDDETAVRSNNDFSRWNLSGSASVDLPGLKRFSLNHDSFEREGGVPGIGSNQSSVARAERRRRITYLKLEPVPLMDRRIKSELTLFHSWTAERFDDPLGDVGPGKQKADNRIRSWGGNLRSTLFPPVVPLSLDLFMEGKREAYHPASYYPEFREGPDRTRESATAAVAGNLSLLGDRAVFSAGVRSVWSESEFYDDQPFPWLPPLPRGKVVTDYSSPHAGLKIRPGGGITIKGNIGRHYRMPTFFELFGNIGSVTGNSGLEPEKGLNRDIGLVFSRDRAWALRRPYLEALYFDNDIDDLILFFQNTQRTVKPFNIGSARVRGAEVSASAGLSSHLRLSGNYTYMDARDTSDIPYYNGNRLASTPAHEGSVGLAFSKNGWEIGWSLHYIGSNFLDKANMEEVPGRSIHSVSVSAEPFGKGFSFTLEGRNLTDNQISDISGFPLPGRSFYMTMNFSARGVNDDSGE